MNHSNNFREISENEENLQLIAYFKNTLVEKDKLLEELYTTIAEQAKSLEKADHKLVEELYITIVEQAKSIEEQAKSIEKQAKSIEEIKIKLVEPLKKALEMNEILFQQLTILIQKVNGHPTPPQ